jgi:chromosome segregation ATPase
MFKQDELNPIFLSTVKQTMVDLRKPSSTNPPSLLETIAALMNDDNVIYPYWEKAYNEMKTIDDEISAKDKIIEELQEKLKKQMHFNECIKLELQNYRRQTVMLEGRIAQIDLEYPLKSCLGYVTNELHEGKKELETLKEMLFHRNCKIQDDDLYIDELHKLMKEHHIKIPRS